MAHAQDNADLRATTRRNPSDKMYGTAWPATFASLSMEFTDEVKYRSQGGRRMSYITARTVMNRLDEVLGPENWWDTYRETPSGILICSISIRLPDGTMITKEDAGGRAGMNDHGDDDKSGVSDAFKRAAVKFGVGRHLYNDGVPEFEFAAESGSQERAGTEGYESQEAPEEQKPPESPKPSSLLVPGQFVEWIASYSRRVNERFAEQNPQHPIIAAGGTLVDRDSLLIHLRDAAKSIGAIAVPDSVRGAELERGLARVFDIDPPTFKKIADEYVKTRVSTATKVTRGFPAKEKQQEESKPAQAPAPAKAKSKSKKSA